MTILLSIAYRKLLSFFQLCHIRRIKYCDLLFCCYIIAGHFQVVLFLHILSSGNLFQRNRVFISIAVCVFAQLNLFSVPVAVKRLIISEAYCHLFQHALQRINSYGSRTAFFFNDCCFNRCNGAVCQFGKHCIKGVIASIEHSATANGKRIFLIRFQNEIWMVFTVIISSVFSCVIKRHAKFIPAVQIQLINSCFLRHIGEAHITILTAD